MQCEKSASLQATNDTDPVISDFFILEGHLTDLYLYPQELKIQQKDKTRTIPFKFGLNFSVLQKVDGDSVGLQFSYKGLNIQFTNEFWPKGRDIQWETHLLKYITRSGFHPFFKPIRQVGRGNFAAVYLAEDLKAKRKVAVKAFKKETSFQGDGKASLQNEIKLMRRLRHPNIVSLHGVYETQNSVYLSMDFVDGYTLDTFLKKYKVTTIEQRKKIMKGLISALRELAEQKIVHRDIKPDNIIVSDDCDVIKIVDFGLATHIDQPAYLFVRCGTPGFVAPEILKIKDMDNVRLGTKSDMFSLGAIYYHLIYGQPLFPGKDQNEVLKLNRQCGFKLAPREKTAYGELELLCRMLEYNPFGRISPEDALKSTFLQDRKDIFLRALQPIQPESTNEWFFDEE